MHFDNQAKEWDNDPGKHERAKVFADEIKQYIQPQATWTALEFGSGTGLLSYYLKDAFGEITLADTSEGMVKVLQEKIEREGIKNFKPLLIDLLESGNSLTNFNVVYTLMTLHHIHDLDKVAQLFHSLLDDGGFLCIADLVKEDGSFHVAHPGFDGHKGFDKEELASIMQKNGLALQHYKICYEIEKNTAGEKKKYPLFFMVCKKNG